MAFADYLDLRTAVIEAVGRTDIAEHFDRITKLAENWLSRNLRMQQQITETTLTLTGGTATLPTDYVESIAAYDSTGTELNQNTLQDIEADTSTFEGNVKFQYYAAIPTLTTSMTTTNWLLAAYPDVYLYAVGYQAALDIRDAEMAQAMRVLRDDAVFDARTSDHRSRYGRTRVRVKGPTP